MARAPPAPAAADAAPASPPAGPEHGLFGFRPAFWVANGMELLERTSYYGAIAITALYFVQLGYSPAKIGVLFAVVLPLPYVVPLVAGALAEKLGYKPTILVAFFVYTGGYLVLATLHPYWALLLGIVLVGVGAGTFKPIAASTIGLVTVPEQRNLAYTTFYWCVNIGAFIGPLVVAFFSTHYTWAFYFAAAMFLLNAAFTLAFYRNPRPPERTTRVWAALARLVEIVRDGRFLLLIVIFAGFWFMYQENFSFIAPYLQRYVAFPRWFRLQFYATVNPAVILLFALPIGYLTRRVDSLKMMVYGMFAYVVGLAIVGLVGGFWGFVAGMAVATVGELMAQPGFLSYVSKIAPEGRMAVYQSYGFLALFLGFFVGPLVGGQLYQAFAIDQPRPAAMWAIVCLVGLGALAALILFARFTADPHRRPRGIAGPLGLALVVVLVPVLLAGAALAGTSRVLEGAAGGDGTHPRPGLAAARLPDLKGHTNEGSPTTTRVELPGNATGNATFILEWTDEAGFNGLPATTNEPDSFRIQVDRPGAATVTSATVANPQGSAGRVAVAVPVDVGAGAFTVTVDCTTAGDYYADPPHVKVGDDPGNDWVLHVVYEHPKA